MVIRTPIRILASPNPGRAAAALARGNLGVALYNIGRPELAELGIGLPEAAMKLPRSPSVRAWDFPRLRSRFMRPTALWFGATFRMRGRE